MKERYNALEVEMICMAPQDAIAKSRDYELPAIPYGLDNDLDVY